MGLLVSVWPAVTVMAMSSEEVQECLKRQETDFRQKNGLNSPMLFEVAAKSTLGRLHEGGKGEAVGVAQFFKDVSDGADVYFGLASGAVKASDKTEALYEQCRKVISFVYATSFFQRPDHEGPTEAVFECEGAGPLPTLLGCYFLKALGADKRLAELIKGGINQEVASQQLIGELNKKQPKNSLVEWIGAGKNKEILYEVNLNFRATLNQSHRTHEIGRYKMITCRVWKSGAVTISFCRSNGTMNTLKSVFSGLPSDDKTYNLGVVPTECKKELQRLVKNIGLLDLESFQKIQKSAGVNSEAISFVKRYALKNGLNHLKNRYGTEVRMTGEELYVYSYFMRAPEVVAQKKGVQSLSIDDKVLGDFCIARGLWIEAQNLQDSIRKAHQSGVFEKLQKGSSIPQDLSSSVWDASTMALIELRGKMEKFCESCSSALPLPKGDRLVCEYFERAQLMIKMMLEKYSNDPLYVFEQQFFDFDDQKEFFSKEAEKMISSMVVCFNTEKTNEIKQLYGVGKTDKIIATWDEWMKAQVEAGQSKTDSFWTQLKEVGSNLKEFKSWTEFKKKLANKTSDKDDRIELVDTAMQTLFGEGGTRSFVKETNAFIKSVPGVSPKLFDSQRKLRTALLEVVSKAILKEDGCMAVRNKMENIAKTWKDKVADLSKSLESIGYAVSFGAVGLNLRKIATDEYEQLVKMNFKTESNARLFAVQTKNKRYDTKLMITLGKMAFINRVHSGFNKAVYKKQNLQELSPKEEKIKSVILSTIEEKKSVLIEEKKK